MRWNAENSEASGFQESIALQVSSSLEVMDRPINFHDELALVAVEIRDKRSDGLLPPKLRAAKSSASQCFPKPFLGGR